MLSGRARNRWPSRSKEEERVGDEVRKKINQRRFQNGCLTFLVLIALVFVCTVVVVGTSGGEPSASNSPVPVRSQSGQPQSTPVPLLEIQSFKCTRDKTIGSAYVEGRVKNVSALPMDQVLVTGNWYTPGNWLWVSNWTFIDLQPILPDQTSSFRTISIYDPLMVKCQVSFQYFLGGAIPSKQQ